MGGDFVGDAGTFQPTLPARGATASTSSSTHGSAYFNPRSPHGERPSGGQHTPPEQLISTHAPRTGSDCTTPSKPTPVRYFNPRSPHGERHTDTGSLISEQHFNPRSPHGERPVASPRPTAFFSFQPTLPARGATIIRSGLRDAIDISTHAPRTGSDCLAATYRGTPAHFNPRSPHGERRRRGRDALSSAHFNPRSPHGERRRHTKTRNQRETFQPTLPARGATLPRIGLLIAGALFQPTLPARGATATAPNQVQSFREFQPTLPARGATMRTSHGRMV